MLPLSSCVYVIELDPLEARYSFALLCVRYSVLVVPLTRTPLVFQSPTSVQLTFKLKGQITSAEPMAAEGSTDILLAIHRPTDEQIGNPHGDGVNDEGLPDDPVATAEDAEGANSDGAVHGVAAS